MTWFCLASGPSMCREDAEAIRGHGKIIAINNTIQLAPWADVLYSCDPQWWSTYAHQLSEFTGKRICLLHKGIDPPVGCESIEWEPGPGLGRERIRTGHNSGYQAINYAYLQGARRIVLLGYDMQHKDGRHHWHDDHPAHLGNFNPGMPDLCARQFPMLAGDLKAARVRVINASRETALTCFERMPLERVLA